MAKSRTSSKKSGAKKTSTLSVIAKPTTNFFDTILKKVKPVLTKTEFAKLKSLSTPKVDAPSPPVAAPVVTIEGNPQVIRVGARVRPTVPVPVPSGMTASPALHEFASLVHKSLKSHKHVLTEHDLNAFVKKSHPGCIAILEGRTVTLREAGQSVTFSY